MTTIPSAQSLHRNPFIRASLALTFALFIIAWVLGGTIFLIRLTILSTIIMVFISLLRFAACFTPKPADHKAAEIDWPAYTVLVPLYKEANVARNLVKHLSLIDYPAERLEIFLICETDDRETINAIPTGLPKPFKIIEVPESEPRTKPKALNYALQFAHGEIITIYDAEDRPHPDQLKTAARAFMDNPDWAAAQAPLDYYNSDDNFLTRQFTIEYAALFHVWLPFLARLGLPFPLGGTSNHIRMSTLKQTIGWDAHNVTEDADMSFRIAALSGRIGYISPPTGEEAVMQLGPWISQRSRWMKGFLQTWLVHMSRPLTPGGAQGVKRQLTLQLTIGATLLAGIFHVPSLIGLSLFYWLGPAGPLPQVFAATMALCYGCGLCIGAVGVIRAGKPGLLWQIPLMPIYWILLFIPTLRALYELSARPFYWSKTAHGIAETAQQ